jgi:hypothetical protein
MQGEDEHEQDALLQMPAAPFTIPHFISKASETTQSAECIHENLRSKSLFPFSDIF